MGPIYMKAVILIPDDQRVIYEMIGFPYNVFILNKFLIDRLDQYPDEEYWTEFRYYKSPRKKNTPASLIAPNDILISTKGRMVSLRESPHRFLHERGFIGYKVCSYGFDGNEGGVLIHRGLACSFIHRPFELESEAFSKLHVNHKDGVRDNNCFSNLEWTTHRDNIQHAFDTGLYTATSGKERAYTKAAKGTILAGKHKGLEFVILGRKNAEKFRFNAGRVRTSCRNPGQVHKGCSWEYITREAAEALPEGLSLEIIEDLEASK